MNEDARFSLRPLPQPGGGKNIPKAHVLQVFVKEKKQKQGSKRTLPFGQKKKIEDEHVQRKYVNFTSYPTSRPTQIGEYTPMYMDQMPPLVGKPLKMAGFLAQKFGVPRLLFKLGGRDALCNVRELDKWSERWDPRVILPSIPQRPCALTDIMASPESPYVTAMDLQKLYISGKITPSQVISNVLEIITTNPTVQQTFVTIDFLTVLKAAAASTLRYQKGQPLSIFDGIPVGVKDEVNVKGLPTTFCCKLADFDQNELRSAWAIEKLEEMGSIIIGKTTMHEMGIDNLCINPVNGVCRNPWDPSRLSGGSSGGSAFAAAAGLCPITIGADGGGSIRVPASWCGMYGLKASFGRISNDPRPSFGPDWSANVIGPMAATMQDLEMTYLVMAKQNPLDALGAAMPALSVYCKEKPVLGVYWPWFNDCSPQVLQTCKATLEYFKSAFNAEIVDIEVPYIHEGRSASLLTLLAEMAATFRKFPDTHKLSPATQIMYSIGQIVSVEVSPSCSTFHAKYD